MSYDILKNLGLERADTGSADFLKRLERMQREAWESLQRDDTNLHGESGSQDPFTHCQVETAR